MRDLYAPPKNATQALIFDIKRDCSEDGAGIRTTVFFKGCPLACIWCQNPEGQDRRPSLSFRSELCAPERCGAPCMAVCPAACLLLPHSEIQVLHERCIGCGQCVEQCSAGALQRVGYWIGLEDLLYRVLVDKAFFQSSGGGVTVSGGEATLQAKFLQRFLQRLKQENVSTALETCGFFNYRVFQQRLLPWLDAVYFDLKLLDDDAHRQFTGQSNKSILANLLRLHEEPRVSLQVRIPLIPGITATRANLSAIARFLREHGIKAVYLMPYNPLWIDKLKRLGLTSRYGRRQLMSNEEIAACIADLGIGQA